MSNQPRSRRAIAICLFALAALTALDLWTKSWAEDTLSREPGRPVAPACELDRHGQYEMQRWRAESIVLVPNFLELRYDENCGAAFGMLNTAPRWVRLIVFLGAGFAAIVWLLVMFVRGYGGTLFAWAVPLVVSGAAGNITDRVRLGYVVDFIRLHYYDKAAWPTFNVADATITVGVVLLLLDGFRKPDTAPDGDEAKERAAGGERTTKAGASR
jgi:signal peptidase II